MFTDSISVTVNPYFGEPAPTANAGPDQAVTAFTPVTLPGSAIGVPGGLTPSYEWSQTSGPLVTLNGTTSQNASFTPFANGTYVFSLVVRAGLSESTPDNVTVLVGSVSAPTISSHPVSQSASTGDSAAFSVSATGVPTPTYQWQVSTQASGPFTNLSNAPPYSGVNTPVLTVTGITSTLNNTHYRAIATNSAGSATSNSATLTVTAAALTELVHNGTFSSGMTGWLQFATPDLSYIVSNVTGGVLQFYRVPPPPGTANQAVVFQETGTALNAGAPVTAKFDLGNSSSARLRITVLVLESNFSDLSVCTFWLPPNMPLQPYVMRTHTTRSWINASIYFYAATAGDHGGFYQVDNVSLQYTPAESPASTECVDPLAPSAPGGPDGPSLLVNGNFDTGSLSPWQVFGQIVSQLTGGVFEFYRPAGTPSGVVFQNTGQPVSASEILTATFQLGNSSSVRKRVTVLLHASDFSDLSACTFWLAPGQPLSNYAYRTYATQAWSSAMLSVYPATVGTEQWIRLDNATLQRTPSADIVGTECLEPGALSNAITDRAAMTSMSADGRSQSATIPIAGVETSTVTVGGEDSRASATFELDVSRMEPVISGGPSRLAFRSLLTGTSSRGLIQIRAGDGVWITVGFVGPSHDWEDIEIDLRDLIDSAVEIRFVIEHVDRDGPPEQWLINRIRMAARERPPL